jgi:hypothetical protein
LADFENRDRKFVNANMKTLIKSELENAPFLQGSKSKGAIGWNNYNTMTPGMDLDDLTSKKGLNPKRKIAGNMDLLKKFRYNFHYWLKNCY